MKVFLKIAKICDNNLMNKKPAPTINIVSEIKKVSKKKSAQNKKIEHEVLDNPDVLPIMPPVVLTFANSDSTTAGGLQADIQTISAVGCYPTSVLTAITVQDTVGVAEIHGLSPDIILRQAQAILEDISVSAFKIGLIGNADCARALGDLLDSYDDVPLIYSPVLTTAAGEDFISNDLLDAVIEDLVSQTTILILSIAQARRFCAFIENKDFENATVDRCAEILLNQGCEYILISAYQASSHQANHVLYHHQNNKILTLNSPILIDEHVDINTTLASAVAGYMAHGIEITTAVKLAQAFSWQSYNQGLRLGMGRLLPNRMYWRNEATGVPLNTIGEQIFAESKLETDYPGN